VSPYRYDVDEAVLSIFASARKQQREKLLSCFDRLVENPFLKGDTVQQDHTGGSFR
jgi:hypothetical protein